jgi:hypothetical protein
MKIFILGALMVAGAFANASMHLVCQNGMTATVANGSAIVNGTKYRSVVSATACGDLYLLNIPALGASNLRCIEPNSSTCQEFPETCGQGFSYN